MSMIIAFRHGVYGHNERINLTGEAAEAAMQEKVSENIDYEADLLPDKGYDQARQLRLTLELAAPALDLCMVSPYRRTKSTAKIALGQRGLRMIDAPGLRERDLGAFRDLPRERFHQDYAESAAEKKKHPLTWRPLPAPDRPGESLIETGKRAAHEIAKGLRKSKAGIIALSTHMDVMVALRGRPELGGLTNTTIQQPLDDNLKNPLWVPNIAVDMYSSEDPATGKRYGKVRFFRHVDTLADTDTGWLKIR